MRDVGDVDAEPVVSVRQRLERNRVVEVAGVLAVNRDDRRWTEIRAAAQVLLADRRADSARFGDGFLTVLVGDAVLTDDDLVVDARLVDVSEHLGYAAERAARGRRPAGNLDDHHVAWLGVQKLVPRHLHIHDQAAIERHDESFSAAVVGVKTSDDRCGPALEDPEDPPFGALVRVSFKARDDAVAVHRLIQIAAGDVQVAFHALERPVWHDESEAARVRHDLADDKVHSIGESIPVSAGLDEGAALYEVAHQLFERGALLSG